MLRKAIPLLDLINRYMLGGKEEDTMKEIEKYKKKLFDFTISGCSEFLDKNPEETFYAFAYDCNAEYCEVNLCFNTEESFQKTLKHYKNGPYKEQYDTENSVLSLRYNTGDWKYQCFETLYFETEENMKRLYGENLELQISEVMKMCQEVLEEFKMTNLYKKIPKTIDFIAYCIDHDDEIEVIKPILLKTKK